jgi:DNA-binding transcriptional LysR family regulator
MDIRELESFCRAADFRSFSRAAKSLHVGQSTVTKHIQKLETELGQELFNRNERPMQLTPAGIALMRIAAPLVDGLRRFAEAGKTEVPTQPIKVGCAHGFMNEMLLKVVRAFRDRAPHCPIRIKVGTKPEVIDMVLNGVVDFGMLPNPDHMPSLTFQPLAASERVAITALDHPLPTRPLRALSDIAVYPLVLLGYQTQTRTLLEQALKKDGVVPEIAVEVDSVDMVKRYVELGLGVAIVHKASLNPEDYQSLSVVSLSAFLPSELVGIVTRKDAQLPAASIEFVNILASALKASGAMRQRRMTGQKHSANQDN